MIKYYFEKLPFGDGMAANKSATKLSLLFFKHSDTFLVRTSLDLDPNLLALYLHLP